MVNALGYMCALALLNAPSEADWQQIKQQDGITVWKHSVPDSSAIEFRGKTVFEAPILPLVAAVFGGGHATEWMDHCIEATVLEERAPDHLINYSRIAGPAFFVSDRDMVLDTHLMFDRVHKTVRATFVKVDYPKKPPPSHVVRVAALDGYWEFRQLDATHTDATYQVLSDPGGALPLWVVNLEAQDLPFKTLASLREHVRKPIYGERISKLRKNLDWSGFDVAAN